MVNSASHISTVQDVFDSSEENLLTAATGKHFDWKVWNWLVGRIEEKMKMLGENLGNMVELMTFLRGESFFETIKNRTSWIETFICSSWDIGLLSDDILTDWLNLLDWEWFQWWERMFAGLGRVEHQGGKGTNESKYYESSLKGVSIYTQFGRKQSKLNLVIFINLSLNPNFKYWFFYH